MNYILLLQSYGSVSTRMIAEKMTEPVMRLVRTEDGWLLRDGKTNEATAIERISEIVEEEPIINWGNHIFGGYSDHLFSLNKPSAVILASNKADARLALQKAGVSVPKTYTEANLTWTKECKYPVIVRPAHHHKGRNFHILPNETALTAFLWGKNNWYASELFEKTHEFRVYVGHGKVLFVHEKPLIEGEIRANYAVNHESWPVIKWQYHMEAVNVTSIRAVKALGLDYGAVDIMYNEKNDTVAIAEVNTSPQITTPYTSQKFADYFSWVIRHNFPAHFEIDGKSVFYNNILRD